MSRIKRISKWIAIATGLLVAIALIANGVFAWQSERRFESKIAALRSAGEPTSLAELMPKPVPPERNAAVYLDRVASQLLVFEKAEGQFYETPLGKSWEEAEEKRELPNPEQLAAIRAIVGADTDILSALQKAAACDAYVAQLDFKLPANAFLEQVINHRVSPIRRLARFVRWKMIMLIVDGKSEDAIVLGIEMLKVARLYDRQPLLVHYLVSVAVRGVILDLLNVALRQGQVSDRVRRELEKELALQEDRKPFQQAFRSERAFGISHMLEQLKGAPAYARWPMRNWMLNELEVLDWANRSATQPWIIVRSQADEIAKEQQDPVTLAGFDEKTLIGPSISAAFQAETRHLTLTRCLRVLNALGAYFDRAGKDAESIDKLDLLPDAMIDPWSGESLRLKMTKDGWIVYSVWHNKKDDGGVINFFEGDWGLAPVGHPYRFE